MCWYLEVFLDRETFTGAGSALEPADPVLVAGTEFAVDVQRSKLARSARRSKREACRAGLWWAEEMDTMAETEWDIRNEGRAWDGEEVWERFNQTMGMKFEMVGGKLFLSDKQRLKVLGLLLENVGADQAVQLGNPEVWRRAVAKLK